MRVEESSNESEPPKSPIIYEKKNKTLAEMNKSMLFKSSKEF
jgi:hypothetical protein